MRFSQETYNRMFDALLSEELYFSSSFASDENIKAAIKRVLGRAVKEQLILLYTDLCVHENLDVSFKITDPDGDAVTIRLLYGE